MPSQIDSTYLCQLTAAQIQEILVLNGVSIQQYQPQLHRWLTVAQLPDLGQLTLSLEPEKAAEIDLRLHHREIVEFTAMTTVMNINICDRYVFIPLLEQPDTYDSRQSKLWGRICLSGNLTSVWTAQDLSWVQALGQQLLTALNLVAEFTATHEPTMVGSSPLADLAELIERIGTLESVCQQKDDFINHISHDLRAPLMNIKMAMRMLKTSLETDVNLANLLSGHRSQKYLQILEQECDREVELIDRILDLQRLEIATLPGCGDRLSSQNQQIDLEPVEMSTWLLVTITPFMDRVQLSQQILMTSMSDWLPILNTDRIYLTKILTELLNNACKYTQPSGKILVSIKGNPESAWLTIEVENQAEILAQHLPHIFKQFYRIPGANRSQQGTGLGLSLVLKLVQQLKGKIDVISADGWTKFIVQLPVDLTKQDRVNVPNPPALTRTQILSPDLCH
jgi:signal transduction histidine kinase